MLPEQIKELQGDEGFRLQVYDDATGQPIVPGTLVQGHPTIAYGRALDVHGISDDEAASMLAADISVTETALNKFEWFVALNDVRKGVMVNLAYNMGVAGLLTFVQMLKYAEDQDWDNAAGALSRSKWATQVQHSRSTRLIAQLRSGST